MAVLIETCFRHSRAVLAVLTLLLIAGFVTWQTIPKESTPDIKIPLIYISLTLEGIAPEDAERLLLRPTENKVRSIEGIKELKATAYQGGANLILKFTAGFNSDKALRDVREKVDEAKSDLPMETREPVVKEINLSLFPVLAIHLSGNVPQRKLFELARDLRDQIESRVHSVLEVLVVGDRLDVVEVIADPQRLEAYNLSPVETVNLIKRNNTLVTVGAIDTGKGNFSLKVPGVVENVENLMALPLLATPQSVVTIGDVAQVRRTYKDATGYSRHFGKPAITLEVSKRTGENILDTIAKVHAVVEDVAKDWPSTVHIDYSQDESKKIRNMIADLQNNLIAAVLLVFMVMVVALGIRSSLLVGIAVPGSFLMGVLIIAFLGYTLNIVVLFSLILSVGMLVDGAIIVVEYADRKMIHGMSAFEAYLTATRRMTGSVFSSIGIILVVFLPLLFWPGVVGQFMKFMPITLIATLFSSILMALIFIPTIGSFMGRVSSSLSGESLRTVELIESGDLRQIKGLTGKYLGILEKALNHPGKVIVGCCMLIYVAQTAYNRFGKGVEFFPEIEPEIALVKVRARGNLSVAEKDALVFSVEKKILDVQGVASLYSNTDVGPGHSNDSDLQEDVIGLITLEFKEWRYRQSVETILKDVQNRIGDIPGLYVEIMKQKKGPSGEKPLQVQISSAFPELLDPARQTLVDFFATLQGVTNVEDNKSVPGIEWVLTVDRGEALKFGADISLIGSTIKLLSNGMIVDTYRPNDVRDEVDILVRFSKAYRSLDQLHRIKVRTPKGLVPISHFVTYATHPKVNTLKRSDGKRVYLIRADVLPGVLVGDKIKEIQEFLKKHPLNSKVSVHFKGEEEDRQETSQFLGRAFGIAICSIAIILLAQFNSFFSMMVIMSSVLYSTVGMFFGLLITHQAFSIVMCGIGAIALSGIIVSNNILMMVTFDDLKLRYHDIREAILRTCAERLRPIVLTKLTAGLGLLPIMLGLNLNFAERIITHGEPSTQWWIQLSTCIVTGIAFASPLTLIVTPCILMLRENYRRKRQQKHRLKP